MPGFFSIPPESSSQQISSSFFEVKKQDSVKNDLTVKKIQKQIIIGGLLTFGGSVIMASGFFALAILTHNPNLQAFGIVMGTLSTTVTLVSLPIMGVSFIIAGEDQRAESRRRTFDDEVQKGGDEFIRYLKALTKMSLDELIEHKEVYLKDNTYFTEDEKAQVMKLLNEMDDGVTRELETIWESLRETLSVFKAFYSLILDRNRLDEFQLFYDLQEGNISKLYENYGNERRVARLKEKNLLNENDFQKFKECLVDYGALAYDLDSRRALCNHWERRLGEYVRLPDYIAYTDEFEKYKDKKMQEIVSKLPNPQSVKLFDYLDPRLNRKNP